MSHLSKTSSSSDPCTLVVCLIIFYVAIDKIHTTIKPVGVGVSIEEELREGFQNFIAVGRRLLSRHQIKLNGLDGVQFTI